MSRLVANKTLKRLRAIDTFIEVYLSQDERDELNELAMWEFFKPVKFRFSPMQLLNKITEKQLQENKKTIASFG